MLLVNDEGRDRMLHFIHATAVVMANPVIALFSIGMVVSLGISLALGERC